MFFVIEDGYNTSYMSALFVGLFYEPSCIERLLFVHSNQTINHNTYLQKLIKLKFVDNIRNDISIPSTTLNEIRNYSYLCGWKITTSINELLNLYDVIDFLEFLLKIFSYPVLEINNTTNYYITLEHPNCTNVTELYNNWCNTNTIKNIPSFVVFKINRDILKKTPIDIMKGIKLFKNDDMLNHLIWSFHCAICKNAKNNSYYCILTINNKLYIWDSEYCPNLLCYDKLDKNNIYKIKTDIVCLIYKKNNNI